MLAFLAQVRSVVGSVASVGHVAWVVVAYVVVCAAASAVGTRRKDLVATSRVKTSMRTTQGPINLVDTVDTVVFVWIALVVVTVEATVTLNLTQASKLWFAM
jgi:hypothetical protein